MTSIPSRGRKRSIGTNSAPSALASCPSGRVIVESRHESIVQAIKENEHCLLSPAALRRHFDRVIRGTRGRQPRPGPAVGFIGGKEGLIAKADCGDVFVEYRIPGSFAAESLWLPFEFLGDCEGKTDDVVELETKATHRVTAKWHDRSGPQNISYNVPSPPAPTVFQQRPAISSPIHSTSYAP